MKQREQKRWGSISILAHGTRAKVAREMAQIHFSSQVAETAPPPPPKLAELVKSCSCAGDR